MVATRPKSEQNTHMFSYISYAHCLKVTFSGIFGVLVFDYSPVRLHVEFSIVAAWQFVSVL